MKPRWGCSVLQGLLTQCPRRKRESVSFELRRENVKGFGDK